MFQYTMRMIVQLIYLVLSSATILYETFCYSFLIRILLLFVCLPSQQNVFYSPTTGTEKLQEAHIMFQYTMRMIVQLIYLVLSSATILYETFCYSFLIRILLLFFLPQQQTEFQNIPYVPVRFCCIETPTNHLHTTFSRLSQYSMYLFLSSLYIKIRNKHTIPHYTIRLQPKTQHLIIFIYIYHQVKQNTELIHCPQLFVNGKHHHPNPPLHWM